MTKVKKQCTKTSQTPTTNELKNNKNQQQMN